MLVSGLALLFVVTHMVTNCDGRHRGKSEPGLSIVDELRLELLDLVHDLWKDVTDPRWVAQANDSLGGADIELLRAFQTLGDTLESRQPPGLATAGAELASLWQWARAEAELKGIDALHGSFRRFQQQQTRGDKLPAPQRAWTDLAETILQDPTSSVPQALSRLNEIIENKKGGEGNLFQQALKVKE